jgi:hypothetical protein
MPSIEITADQRDRLRAVQEELSADVVGKYGHVRPCDAVEYLLDRHAEATPEDGDGDAAGTADADPAENGADGNGDGPADDPAENGADGNGDVDEDGDARADAAGSVTGGGPLDGMMNLLDEHEDRWREGGGDARYEVDLPDGSVEPARTKDDVRALLFRHYR